jgi:hypothetical protein
MSQPPKIENAPGLVWRPCKWGWKCRWQARSDLIAKGWLPKSTHLWIAAEDEREPSDTVKQWIADHCNVLQHEMLVWARGGVPIVTGFNGTIRSLVESYQTDPDSSYRKLRYRTRERYDNLCRRMVKDRGNAVVADIKGRTLLRWHETWKGDGKVAMAHSMIGLLRTLATFGSTILDNDECRALKAILHDMRFPMIKPRSEALSADQADAIRARAHYQCVPSIAIAQAFQFDCMLRQKDVIGEWVPIAEPGMSAVTKGNDKWIRGIQWQEIDADLVLHHVTSKRQKMIDVPLRHAPMVMEELRRIARISPEAALTRDMLPASGPVVIHDRFGVPWVHTQFRRRWREFADDCGIPRSIKNMDSRAGAISEATDAGADLEHVRHAATHGDIQMTQRYSRNSTEKVAGVMRTRAAYRNKSGTKD